MMTPMSTRPENSAVEIRLSGGDLVTVRPFRVEDEPAVVAMWRACLLVRPSNDPHRDIERKLKVQPELFLVAERNATIVGSAMAGYDGHRGWVNYLGVLPECEGNGLGRALMTEVERRLVERGCPKVNLQVRTSNGSVIEFYHHLGYVEDDVVSLGKRLIPDTPAKK
jgi:ribosomal protein S18 acetylase RimI-like enzyme